VIGPPVVAPILASAGFERIAFGMEHGIVDRPQATAQMMAIRGTACVPMCRLPANDPVCFKFALDGGAAGVIVPTMRSL
jgi:2-keto-3-deoxy-L-rhamnonate aldolase RhmA